MAQLQAQRPRTTQRYRQFGQIRHQKSQQRSIASRSRYQNNDRSMNASFIRRLDYGNSSTNNKYNENNKTSKYAKQTTGTNKIAGDKKKQKQSRKSQHSRSFHDFGTRNKTQSQGYSKLLCVGCFNKEMCEHKMKAKKHQQELEKSRYSNRLINEDDDYHKFARSRYDREYQKARDYNKHKIQEHEQAKIKKQQQRQKQMMQAEKREHENIQYREQQRQLLQKRRLQLKKDLQRQIQNRHKRDIKEKQTENLIASSLFGTKEPTREDRRHLMEQKYRAQLLKQINDGKARKQEKQRQNLRRKNQFELQIMTHAAEQQKKKEQQIQMRRKMLAQQQQKVRKQKQAKLQREQQRKERQEHERLAMLQQQNQQYLKKQANRQRQLDKYLSDLKKQMEINREKKQQQYKYQHRKTNTSIFAEKPQIMERQCDSCEKKYPETYLTRVTNAWIDEDYD